MVTSLREWLNAWAWVLFKIISVVGIGAAFAMWRVNARAQVDVNYVAVFFILAVGSDGQFVAQPSSRISPSGETLFSANLGTVPNNPRACKIREAIINVVTPTV